MNSIEDKIKIVNETHHKKLSDKYFSLCNSIPQTLSSNSTYQIKRNIVSERIKGKAVTHSRIAMEIKNSI